LTGRLSLIHQALTTLYASPASGLLTRILRTLDLRLTLLFRRNRSTTTLRQLRNQTITTLLHLRNRRLPAISVSLDLLRALLYLGLCL
ncbi:hypothetical protein QP158_11620, partial [Streptococcus agalactiae]|nr:hypothetical protein [Streptococcus agalactiae]